LTELKNHEKLYTGIVEASLDPVFGINEKGIIQFVNNAAVKQFGYSEVELLGGATLAVSSERSTLTNMTATSRITSRLKRQNSWELAA
jgi:PAS domain S-box-containing protein